MATGQAAIEFPQKAHRAACTDIESLYGEVMTRLCDTEMRRHGQPAAVQPGGTVQTEYRR
jgi:hypothetical protein